MPNAFLTVYMTQNPPMDRHPHHDYRPDFEVLRRLAESVAPHGTLIVVTDSLTPEHVPAHLRDTVVIHMVPTVTGNFFMERWDAVAATLEHFTDLELVYVVDGRDVVVVRDPWDYITPGTLYTCTEPATLTVGRRRRQHVWYGQPLGRSGFINDRSFHNSPHIQKWIGENPELVALNAGVIAGDRATVLAFAQQMAEERHTEHVASDYTDMALFNWVAYTGFTVVGSEEFIGAKCHLEADAPNARVLHVP